MNLVKRIDNFILKYYRQPVSHKLGPGLIKVPVRVTRGGTSFIRYQWKKPQDIKSEIESKPYYKLIEDYGNLEVPILMTFGKRNLTALSEKAAEEHKRLRELRRTHFENNNAALANECSKYMDSLDILIRNAFEAHLKARRD